MKIELNDLNIKILQANYFNARILQKKPLLKRRTCYNYELEFLLDADAKMYMDDKLVNFEKSDINFRKPGQTTTGIPPYRGYSICFSLKKDIPLPYPFFGNESTCEENYDNDLLNSIPTKISLEKKNDVKEMFENIVILHNDSNPINHFKAKSILYNLLSIIFTFYSSKTEVVNNKSISKCESYIKRHFCEEIIINDLIEMSGLSKTYFHKCFKLKTGMTPNSYIKKMRFDKAKHLLINTNMKIADISLECGFIDNVYFTHSFKKTVGITPLRYRNQDSFIFISRTRL